jgi:ABC-2 type transport system permease protein
MRHVWLNARIQFAELIRYPSFTVPSIGLPLISYFIFGLPQVRSQPVAAAQIAVSFAAFALLGIAMFQFGVGIAADRATPWERYVRTLPSSASVRFTARTLVALAFGIASLIPLVGVAVLLTPVRLDAGAWLRIGAVLVLGAIPLALLGIMLGYLLSERGALPVTNLIFLPLSYAGGLFGTPVSSLPGFAARISPWLPSRQWSDLLLGYGLAGQFPLRQAIYLAGYGGCFAALAVIGYRRDETREYR